jgi:hypothetical protein
MLSLTMFDIMVAKQYGPVYNTDGDKLVFDPETGMYSVTKENETVGDGYSYKSKEVWGVSPSVAQANLDAGIFSYGNPKALVEESTTEDCPTFDPTTDEDLEMELERLSYKVSNLENKIDELINLLNEN